jgi:uncharacterized protein (TIGR02118 family)
MIKAVWACNRLAGIPDEEFYPWWREVHGHQEWANRNGLRRYVQHHTLPEARGGDPAPTHDGASIAWFDDFDQMRAVFAAPKERPWSATKFNAAMDVVIANERVVVEGATTPQMVKAIVLARRRPDLSRDDFLRHWYEVHGSLWAKVPGVRRYVQNHGIAETYARPYDPARETRVATHDGWSEIWFDDLAALRRAFASPARQAASEDGRQLFAYPMSVVIARENPIVA